MMVQVGEQLKVQHALQRGRDEWLRHVRAALGEKSFEAAWAMAEAMTPEEAIVARCASRPLEEVSR